MKISEEQLRDIIKEKIKKIGNSYVVYPKKGGKRLGTHRTKKAAKKQLAAIEISKSMKNESTYLDEGLFDSIFGKSEKEKKDEESKARAKKRFEELMAAKEAGEDVEDAIRRQSQEKLELDPNYQLRKAEEELDQMQKDLEGIETREQKIARLRRQAAEKRRKRNIYEAYVKRYVADPQGGAIRQELVDAPPRFERQFLQQVYEKFYNQRQVELVNRMRVREGMGRLSYEDRKELLSYINQLDSDTLYNMQSQAYKEARNQTERYVNDQMQANPSTRSDYPGQGTKLVDATRRSQLFYTDNDFDAIYPNPTNIPFQDIQRVAMLDSNELQGIAPGAIQYQGGQQGIEIDAYVDMLASQGREKTDPKQGASVVNTDIGSLKRPVNFVPDPSFVSVPIEDDEYETKTL